MLHGKIVGLACHCPWNRCSHPKYIDILKNQLKPVGQAIDKAIITKSHKALKQAENELKTAQTELLNQMKNIDGPLG